jgi:hypothetical protein
MTKQQFLDRMANAYDMGLCTDDVLRLSYNFIDSVMRLEGGQLRYWAGFLRDENNRTDGFEPNRTLANDNVAYKAIQLLSIMIHPCQKCATDPEAWHTRSGFCNHKGQDAVS